MATVEELSKLKVTELKAELSKRGLKTAGLKKELVERLSGSIAIEKTAEEVPANASDIRKEAEEMEGETGALALDAEKGDTDSPKAPENIKEAIIEDVSEINETISGQHSGPEKSRR